MIRRDYFLRMVQVLARVIFLNQRQEYTQAVLELDRALAKLPAGRRPQRTKRHALPNKRERSYTPRLPCSTKRSLRRRF